MNEDELLKSRLEDASECQLKRYERITKLVNMKKLTAQNKRFLLWLAIQDEDTRKNLLEIAKHVK